MISRPTQNSQQGSHNSLKLEALCSDFESRWSASQSFGDLIEEFIQDADPTFRKDLIVELVAIDVELRASAGQTTTPKEYLNLFPDDQSSIEDAFDWLNSEMETTGTAGAGIPETLGEYRIVREIGRGGMGVVYEAVQENLGRRVAIKTLYIHPLMHPGASKRFARESRAIAELRHPNIVDIIESGHEAGFRYFAMELVDGGSLRDWVERCRREIADQGDNSRWRRERHADVIRYGIQIARALQYAHQKGVLHRDIKPSNLLLNQSGDVKVTDFGLAKLLHEDDDATRSGDVVGTLRYLPPESIDGSTDQRGDLYALGATLYELLTLQPAFAGSDHTQTLDQITRGHFANLRSIDSSIEQDLETVVLKAMAHDPNDRYPSAAAFADDLERVVDFRPIHARQTGALQRVRRWSRREPALATLWVVLILVATVGVPALASLWYSADRARQQAEHSQQQAEQRRIESDEASELARARDYGSTIQLAQSYMNDGMTDEAHELMDQTRGQELDLSAANSAYIDRRDWEWFYLRDRLDTSTMILRGHTGPVFCTAVAPDDSQIATAGGNLLRKMPGPATNEVILWDAKTGTRQHTFASDDDAMTGVAYHPDGNQLATIGVFTGKNNSGRGGVIKIWDPGTGDVLTTLPLGRKHPQWLFDGFWGRNLLPGVQFSRDGEYLLSWLDRIEIRRTDTWELVRSFTGFNAHFLPRGKLAVFQRPGRLDVYDIETGKRISRERDLGRVHTLSSDADIKTLGAVGQNRFRLWDLTSMKSHQIPSLDIQWAAISPDGRHFASSSRKGLLTIGDLSSTGLPAGRAVSMRFGHRSNISHGAFSRDGWLVTASHDSTARVWNLRDQSAPIVTETDLRFDCMSDIHFANDGDRIVYAASRYKAVGGVVGWQKLDNSSDSNDGPIKTTYHALWPRNDFAFSGDGSLLAGPGAEKRGRSQDDLVGFATSGFINVWSSQSRELLETIPFPSEKISCLVWSPDNRFIAVAGIRKDQPVIEVFSPDVVRGGEDDSNLETKAPHSPQWSITLEHDSAIQAMSFHPDGKRLAISTAEATRVVDMTRKDNRRNVLLTDRRAKYLDFSPDGERIAVADPDIRLVSVYSTKTGRLEYETRAPRMVSCVRFSPNGKRLAVVGYDSVVTLCDAKTGVSLLKLNGAESASGTIGFTPRVVFSRDGRRIATNDWQGRITVWSVNPRWPGLGPL